MIVHDMSVSVLSYALENGGRSVGRFDLSLRNLSQLLDVIATCWNLPVLDARLNINECVSDCQCLSACRTHSRSARTASHRR